jgi:hypothetical protein
MQGARKKETITYHIVKLDAILEAKLFKLFFSCNARWMMLDACR